ncbi:MAG: 2-oxoglutarate dehydrogenase complex dihydrolipoyllysine-residue succinyltransferase [Bryobacterales bacterium]|nr:2-oxoglutarate dehydrogenase complex dihydrolipoyllysine-residue succinyltransferase [Bryobacterales bacterium]
MSVDLRVPEAGESIAEVRIGAWHKSEGEYVNADEVVVELETDKAAIELPAPVSGILVSIVRPEGAGAAVGDVIGVIDEHSTEPVAGAKPSKPEASVAAEETHAPEAAETSPGPAQRVMPSAKRVLGEAGVEAAAAKGTGPGGRVLKEDAIRAVESAHAEPSPETTPQPSPEPTASALREEEIVPMSPLRKVIARNLVAAQQSAALLTTFNEVDMSAVIELRKRYKDLFLERHGIKLGFMSFFVKAAVDALQTVPAVNARLDGTQIVYRKYQDIGIAVGGGRGLVVPVLRNAESMSFASIELAIADFAKRAIQNKIGLAELQGGTFTISNGGIYGSMMSTPIVNPPQSGILGMHAIQDRPVAIDGQVVVRPMMYLALTYDHRVVDGREAVTFLRRIKGLVEHPERIWLQL